MGNQASQETTVKHFSKRLQKKFQLSEDEILVDSFLCALINTILIQGELYITPSKLIFHSPFNNRTLFGETLKVIEYQNITYVEKTHGVFGLQNSIYIETSNEEYTFTSFLFRDQAYNSVNQTWVNYLDSIAHTLKFKDSIIKSTTPRKTPKSFIETEGFSDSLSQHRGDEPDHVEKLPAELLALRRRKVLESIPLLSQYRTLGYKSTMTNTDIHQFYNVVLSDIAITQDGKEYNCWWQLFTQRAGAPEALTITDWEPKPPQSFRETKSIIDFAASFSKRTITGKKPLKGGGWFTPKYIEYEETQRLHVLDQKELVVISEVKFLSKFPFSESFEYINCYIIREDDQNEVTIEYRYSLNFIKYCLFQGTIEKQTQEEQVTNGVTMSDILKDLKAQGRFDIPEESGRKDSWENAQIKAEERTKDDNNDNFASLAPVPLGVVGSN
jgi:hypothetical protein